MRVLKTQITRIEEHFQVELNQWSKDLTVEVGGHGVVSHAGRRCCGCSRTGPG